MRLKIALPLLIVALFACAEFDALAQTTASAKGPKIFSPLAVGVGFSGYNPDYDHGHLLGGTLWIDYTPAHMPSLLDGLGVEVEARDLNYGRSASQPANLRQDVALGGVVYSWPRYLKFRPYAKFLMGFGNTDETNKYAVRYNDSRTVTATGGGADFRVFKKLWVRADYEYQFWPDFFKHSDPTIPAGRLNPQGFTVGAMYHF